MEVYYEHNKKQISFLVGILLPYPHCLFYIWCSFFITMFSRIYRYDAYRTIYRNRYSSISIYLWQLAPINTPITLAIYENQSEEKESPAGCSADKRKQSLCADQRLRATVILKEMLFRDRH